MAGDYLGEGGWVLEEETSRKIRQNEIIKKLRPSVYANVD
jgi:hypothetical protein